MGTKLEIPTVVTDRLTLRAHQERDLQAIVDFYASDRSRMVGGPRNGADCWRMLATRLGHWALKGYGMWHLTEKSSGEFIGWAGIIDAPEWDEPELGWSLLEAAEGKGMAFEAATAARRYAAEHFGLDGIMSYIAHANDRSPNRRSLSQEQRPRLLSRADGDCKESGSQEKHDVRYKAKGSYREMLRQQ